MQARWKSNPSMGPTTDVFRVSVGNPPLHMPHNTRHQLDPRPHRGYCLWGLGMIITWIIVVNRCKCQRCTKNSSNTLALGRRHNCTIDRSDALASVPGPTTIKNPVDPMLRCPADEDGACRRHVPRDNTISFNNTSTSTRMSAFVQ